MPYDKALKMKRMVDLQWTMISILALSGVTGAPGFMVSCSTKLMLNRQVSYQVLSIFVANIQLYHYYMHTCF